MDLDTDWGSVALCNVGVRLQQLVVDILDFRRQGWPGKVFVQPIGEHYGPAGGPGPGLAEA